MPSGQSWGYFIYINIAFALFAAIIFYNNQMADIKANWSTYRCNPMYMPLADDVESNFTYCIQTMQTSYVGYLLEPITHITNTISLSMGDFAQSINSIRAMIAKMRSFITNIIQSIFGVFLNIIIEFQKIIIAMKDIMGKTIGILVTMLYILSASITTMNSAWNGPPGQTVRKLGKCFHPETKIKLSNNNYVMMKDIQLGDVLENGSIVEAVMKINNNERIPFYTINDANNDINGNVYVTGSHLVYDKSKCTFVTVGDYDKAKKTDIVLPWFSCLITSDHRIQIGNELFWDWEDHYYNL